MNDLIFLFFVLLTIVSAGAVLWSKNVLHSAYYLLLTFVGVAALFVFAQADVLAVAQLMIYVGGVLVLMIFGVMLTAKPSGSQKDKPNFILTENRNRFWGIGIALAMFGVLFGVFKQASLALAERQNFEPIERLTTVQDIGINLMTGYVLPFEVLGILLMAALMGAAYLSVWKK